MPYTDFSRGSSWRKWDLHVHTPNSYHNSFPNWDQYISELKAKAVLHDIEVMGVTDYFCTTGYEKLLLECETTNRDITPRIKLSNDKYLYLIPIIELRLDNFTADNNSVNLHIAFSPKLLPSTIKDSFLEALDIRYQDKTLKCKESDLLKIGHAESNNGQFDVNLDIHSLDEIVKNKYLIKAFSVITFASSTFETQLDNFDNLLQKSGIKKDSYLIIIANKGHGGLADFRWADLNKNASRSGIIRQNLLNLTDICFSNSSDDREFLLGNKPGTNKNEVLSRFRTLKPCIWGSDAHDKKNLFHPSNGATNDYTWIKADPTFEGLKQTLYEPTDRIRIQALKPDIKSDRYIISELKFLDDGNLFGNQSIFLNENLNAIIGGKSSGKSLLLYSTAQSIDPNQVENASKRLGFTGYKFTEGFKFEVIWKNGDVDRLDNNPATKTHKITYIPQLYINYLVEKDNKEDLNSLIKSILLQDYNFKQEYDDTLAVASQITATLNEYLTTYLDIRTKINALSTRLKEVGTSEALSKSISNKEAVIADARKLSKLTESEFRDYQTLTSEKDNIQKQQTDLKRKEETLNKILGKVVSSKLTLLGDPNSEPFPIKGEITRILDEFTEVPQDVEEIAKNIDLDFDLLISNLKDKINLLGLDKQKDELRAKSVNNTEKLKPFLVKIQGQQELLRLSEQLEKERHTKEEALNLEKQIKTLTSDYHDLRKQTAALLKRREKLYKDLVDKVNITKNDIGQGITLNAALIYKLENFNFYQQANRAAIATDHYFHTLFSAQLVNFSLLPDLYSKLLKVLDDKLYLDNITLPLKQKVTLEDILRGLIDDKFEIDYTVSYKNDDLLTMSPGKKGTVLLILFLQISSSEFPILIDQPEDNLDNRTIYDLLCQMIKQKKRERQIIIVSHNANLVVATDSENIIVANQKGQSVGIGEEKSRFEYVNGSIEHTFLRNEAIKSILYQQGIKEHICDILEGGNEAFKQRELKYSL